MANPFFDLHAQTRPDNIKVSKSGLRFGPLSFTRVNTVPPMDFGRPGDMVFIDNTDSPSPILQSSQTPISVGLWVKQPLDYGTVPSGNVVAGFPGGSTQAGDIMSINGTSIVMQPPFTVTQAVIDIRGAVIPNISAQTMGDAVLVVESKGGAIDLFDIAGTPSGTLGLFSQESLADFEPNGMWILQGDITELLGPLISPANTLFVAENGNDSSGNGDLANPFRSIGAAIEVSTSNDVIILLPSINYFEDNPLAIPGGVSIVGIAGPANSVVTPLNPNQPLFTVTSGPTDIRNFTINGVTGAAAITRAGINPDPLLRVISLVFTNCQTILNITGGVVFMTNSVITGTDPYTDIVTMSGGALTYATNTVSPGVIAENIFNVAGDLELNIQSSSFRTSGVTRIINADNGARVRLISSRVSSAANGVRLDNGSTLEILATVFDSIGVFELEVLDLDSTIIGSGYLANRNKFSAPDGYQNTTMLFSDLTQGDQGTVVWGELGIGRPERGSETSMGEGDAYSRNMIVLTTDNTASPTEDGGNLTDVSVAAASFANSTFTFQGTSANHTILVGSSLDDGTDVLKHWGVKIVQAVAAVEATPKSFSCEIWDGVNWKQIGVFARQSEKGYHYGNVLFIRAPSIEGILFGVTRNTTWEKKDINGDNLYWSRIRIATDLIAAPVFNQFLLDSSRTDVKPDGTLSFHGNARFRSVLITLNNTFGEFGKLIEGIVVLGSGGVPTEWEHMINKAMLEKVGDALNFQVTLPRGVDTSSPIKVTVYYSVEGPGPSTDGTIVGSCMPLNVQGILVADPTGGILPVSRTLADTETFTSKPAQTKTVAMPMTENTKIQSLPEMRFDISNYYGGDMLALRVEFTDDGDMKKNILIWTIEVSAVFNNLGDPLCN